MTTPTFYIPPEHILEDTALLSGDELRHARLTLRLGISDTVRVVDGQGTSFKAEIQSMDKEKGDLKLSDRIVEPEPSFELTIAMGIVQGERFDWAVQKGTELGVLTFVPLVTERTEGHFKGKWKRLERLRRIIVSACKQCGRARFPIISEPVFLNDLDMSSYDLSLVFWEEEGTWPLKEAVQSIDPPRSCLVIIGPVGGLTGEEVTLLREKGGIIAGMGPRILRTETAVTTGAALMQFLWGDMG